MFLSTCLFLIFLLGESTLSRYLFKDSKENNTGQEHQKNTIVIIGAHYCYYGMEILSRQDELL